jgi:hypothetical protein
LAEYDPGALLSQVRGVTAQNMRNAAVQLLEHSEVRSQSIVQFMRGYLRAM